MKYQITFPQIVTIAAAAAAAVVVVAGICIESENYFPQSRKTNFNVLTM